MRSVHSKRRIGRDPFTSYDPDWGHPALKHCHVMVSIVVGQSACIEGEKCDLTAFLRVIIEGPDKAFQPVIRWCRANGLSTFDEGAFTDGTFTLSAEHCLYAQPRGAVNWRRPLDEPADVNPQRSFQRDPK